MRNLNVPLAVTTSPRTHRIAKLASHLSCADQRCVVCVVERTMSRPVPAGAEPKDDMLRCVSPPLVFLRERSDSAEPILCLARAAATRGVPSPRQRLPPSQLGGPPMPGSHPHAGPVVPTSVARASAGAAGYAHAMSAVPASAGAHELSATRGTTSGGIAPTPVLTRLRRSHSLDMSSLLHVGERPAVAAGAPHPAQAVLTSDRGGLAAVPIVRSVSEPMSASRHRGVDESRSEIPSGGASEGALLASDSEDVGACGGDDTALAPSSSISSPPASPDRPTPRLHHSVDLSNVPVHGTATRLPQEIEQGNIEYKWRLFEPTPGLCTCLVGMTGAGV